MLIYSILQDFIEDEWKNISCEAEAQLPQEEIQDNPRYCVSIVLDSVLPSIVCLVGSNNTTMTYSNDRADIVTSQ